LSLTPSDLKVLLGCDDFLTPLEGFEYELGFSFIGALPLGGVSALVVILSKTDEEDGWGEEKAIRMGRS